MSDGDERLSGGQSTTSPVAVSMTMLRGCGTMQVVPRAMSWETGLSTGVGVTPPQKVGLHRHGSYATSW